MTAESVPVVCPAVYVKVHKTVPPFAPTLWVRGPEVIAKVEPARRRVPADAETLSAVPPVLVTPTVMVYEPPCPMLTPAQSTVCTPPLSGLIMHEPAGVEALVMVMRACVAVM